MITEIIESTFPKTKKGKKIFIGLVLGNKRLRKRILNCYTLKDNKKKN